MSELPDVARFVDIPTYHARRRGDHEALRFAGRSTSYRDFDRHVTAIAHRLLADGLVPGTRCALLAKNTGNYYEILFGAACAGCVLVPVNHRLAAPEIAFILEDCGAELLFVGEDFAELAKSVLQDCPAIRQVVVIRGTVAGWPDLDAWVADPPAAELPLPGDADTVVQMYTSGTTGLPKGVELTHGNLLYAVQVGQEALGHWTANDIAQIVMPQFHIAGTNMGLVGIYCGATCVIIEDVVPRAVLASIERDRITVTFVVPAVILFLLQAPECAETDFSSLKTIIYGASPIPADLLAQALEQTGCAFAQVYGLTETTGAITLLPAEVHTIPPTPVMKSCGRAFADVEIRVVDADDNPVPVGEVGQVICRTALNMKGYWRREPETAAALRGGWFHTGDAGYLDEEGYLYIYDRVKDMIISGGENIYPAEVESALFGHEAIADVAVIGVPDKTWGEAVKAIVVLAPDAQASEADIIAFARQRIAGFKLPRSVDFVETLPRNPSGKILKRDLREPYWRDHDRRVG